MQLLAARNLRQIETSAGREAGFGFRTYTSVGRNTTAEADLRVYDVMVSVLAGDGGWGEP